MVNLSIIGNVLRIVNCVALELPHICHVKYNNCQPLSIKRGNIDLETLLFLILVTVELPRYLVQAMVVVLSRGWNVHKLWWLRYPGRSIGNVTEPELPRSCTCEGAF